MGWRFYRSFKLLPGFRVNISKSGLSGTVGVRGANMNVAPGRRRYTFGLPGSGLSHITSRSIRGAPMRRGRSAHWLWWLAPIVLLLFVIF